MGSQNEPSVSDKFGVLFSENLGGKITGLTMPYLGLRTRLRITLTGYSQRRLLCKKEMLGS